MFQKDLSSNPGGGGKNFLFRMKSADDLWIEQYNFNYSNLLWIYANLIT